MIGSKMKNNISGNPIDKKKLKNKSLKACACELNNRRVIKGIGEIINNIEQRNILLIRLFFKTNKNCKNILFCDKKQMNTYTNKGKAIFIIIFKITNSKKSIDGSSSNSDVIIL